VQWKHYTVPMQKGDPGLDSWPNLDAARHGGAQVWTVGAYDPDTKLYIFGTGNATPAYTPQTRAGDNLFTCTLVAVDIDTGKMKWYYQTSPHDTHDWDSTQTPILADLMFNGRMRKLVLMATRNGYFYVLDRTTGEHLITRKIGLVNNYASGVDPDAQPRLTARGEVIRNPNKDATIAGSLVNSDVTNYPPPTFSPDTGLFYVHEQNGLHIDYLMEPDPRGSMGLGGTSGGASFSFGSDLDAIDYKTGKVKWRHDLTEAAVGETSTAGGVLFLSNSGGIEALDAATGRALWHSEIGPLSSPPETFLLDGKQHVLATGASGLYMFVLN
jgi:alcohol dehydrogenase (cytochrome c)